MSFVELLLVAIGLSMDAFAVSVCKGLSVKKLGAKHALIAGAYFGGFQFLMPVIGWFLGSRFEHIITTFDHWIAFGLLAIIGVNMIQESFSKAEELNDDFGVRTMLMMAVATSIDALAVGVTFACLNVRIPYRRYDLLPVRPRHLYRPYLWPALQGMGGACGRSCPYPHRRQDPA